MRGIRCTAGRRISCSCVHWACLTRTDRPLITAARSDGIKWVTFSTGLSSNKVKRLKAGNKAASVCFLSESYNVSLMGTLEVSTDPAVKKENWYDALSHHFSGPDDPEYCVLIFTTKRYNLLLDFQEVRGEI